MNPRPKTITYLKEEAQEPEQKPINLELFKRIFSYTRIYSKQRRWLIVTVILRAVQLPTLAWAIGSVLGGPVARMDTNGIILGTLGYAFLAAFTQYNFRWRMYLALDLGEKVIHDLRSKMFHHLQDLSMSFFNRTKIGRTISRFTSDSEAVRTGVQEVVFVSTVGIGQMIFSAMFMIYYDWVLFLSILGIAPVMFTLNRIFRHKIMKLFRATQEVTSRMTAAFAESIKGIKVTQGFGRQDLNTEMFKEIVVEQSQINVHTDTMIGIYYPLLDINSQLFTAIILIFGGWRVLNGLTDVETLYQFVMISSVFFGPINNLAGQYNGALTAMAGAERVFSFLDRKPDWVETENLQKAQIQGRIEFKNITFSYVPDKPVLQDISFTIDAGKTLALVGHTGSGKTTIINLVSKFYLPQIGELLIDGIDVRNIEQKNLHSQMGIVLQQNFLFTGTVIDNVRVGKPDATLEEIKGACMKLDCIDLIESLPNGFETIVGEGGTGISLGQRQLICFARAMIADPRILILDEATSSVDTITEARIQKALTLLLNKRTSIVIAHRLSTIKNADLVLVLENGKIIEQGTHRQLLKKRGHYAFMYKKFIS